MKLLDFGVSSKTFGHDVVVGTVRYMAPEVLRGELAERASDLFVWIVVSMPPGRHPFESANDEAARGRSSTTSLISGSRTRRAPIRWRRRPACCEKPCRDDGAGRGLETRFGEVFARRSDLRALPREGRDGATDRGGDAARELATAIGRTHQAVDGTHAPLFVTAARFVGRQAELRATERLDRS